MWPRRSVRPTGRRYLARKQAGDATAVCRIFYLTPTIDEFQTNWRLSESDFIF
jgi:hypothetical protein